MSYPVIRIVGQSPQLDDRVEAITTAQFLSRYFNHIYTPSPVNSDPNDPIVHNFLENACYMNVRAVNFPPAKKKTARSVWCGNLNYRTYRGLKFQRPETVRNKRSVDTITLTMGRERCKQRKVGIFYPETRTLVLANFFYSVDSHNIRQIIQKLSDSIEGGLQQLRPINVRNVENIKIGADPEFEVLNDHLRVIDPDYSWFPNRLSAKIGLDGAGKQIELRPSPGTPHAVVEDVTSLMKKCRYKLCTIGNTHPLGAHIHAGYGFQYNPPYDLKRLLDEFLGFPTIELSGFARGYYKKLSAVEPKSWGFEYRSAPAAIFDSPRMAELSMTIVKNICERYARGSEFKVHTWNVGKDDYVNNGVLTAEQYDEWASVLMNYQACGMPYDCRLNWVEADQLAESANLNEPDSFEPDAQAVNEVRLESNRQRDRNARCQLLDHMNIAFGDDWEPELLTIMRDEIRSRTQNHVRLFGLSSPRGDVTYGYDVGNGYTDITGTPGTEQWAGSFGVPHHLRTFINHNVSYTEDPDRFVQLLRPHAIAIAEAVDRMALDAAACRDTEREEEPAQEGTGRQENTLHNVRLNDLISEIRLNRVRPVFSTFDPPVEETVREMGSATVERPRPPLRLDVPFILEGLEQEPAQEMPTLDPPATFMGLVRIAQTPCSMSIIDFFQRFDHILSRFDLRDVRRYGLTNCSIMLVKAIRATLIENNETTRITQRAWLAQFWRRVNDDRRLDTERADVIITAAEINSVQEIMDLALTNSIRVDSGVPDMEASDVDEWGREE